MEKSIAPFFESEPDDRKADLLALHKLITEKAPDLEPFLLGKYLGYGRFHFKYASGREGDWFRIGISKGKSGISIHSMAANQDGYLVESYAPQLPKANVGKGCIRFKKLAVLDLKVLSEIIERTAAFDYSVYFS